MNMPFEDAYIFTSFLILSRYITSWDIILNANFQPDELLHDVMHCIDFIVATRKKQTKIAKIQRKI